METSTESAASSAAGGQGDSARSAASSRPALVAPPLEARRLTVVPPAAKPLAPANPREALVVGTDLSLLAPLVSGLRSKGGRPVLTMAPDQAVRLTERWAPHAVLVLDECGGITHLLHHLHQ